MKKLVDVQELMNGVQEIFAGAVDSKVMECFHAALTTQIHILPKTILVTCKECRFRCGNECLLSDRKVVFDGYCDLGKEFDESTTQPKIELVRCKECIYRMEDNCIFQTGDGGIPDDGYCDYGKRVSDNHEN